MSRERSSETSDAILAVAVELLEAGRYEAVHLREVARRAHVSLASICRRYAIRDDLIVAALDQWMASNGHAPVPVAPPDESLYDGLKRIFRHMFEPWELSLRMLEAYRKAAACPSGGTLRLQGANAIVPAARHLLSAGDPEYLADVENILTSMAYAMTGRFADGQIAITAILPTLERTVYRITTNNEKPQAKRVEYEPRKRKAI